MRKLLEKVSLLFLPLVFCSSAFAVDASSLLAADEAFKLTFSIKSGKTVTFSWTIADGYYLYRDKFKFVSSSEGIRAEKPSMPPAEVKNDPFFGKVNIYRGGLNVDLPIVRQAGESGRLQLEVFYQGCAEVGVCYLPVKKIFSVDLPAVEAPEPIVGAEVAKLAPYIAEQDRISKLFSGHSKALIVLSFLGFGLMMAFTPCVFPMIPIISGIVLGQGHALTTRKAFVISMSYVMASAMTYTVFGVLAGLFGQNLQAVFQQPFVIVSMSAVYLLLGLAMFGILNIQIPSFLQTRLVGASSRQQSGRWYGAAVMGMLSALTIGPCVTAPLAGALIYIGKSGDAILGGLALFSLGFGMGIPLLLVGTSAGKFMPRAGAWMHVTKSIFGVGLLAVGVWLLARILPWQATMVLWGVLLMVPLAYLGWKKLWKIVAILAVAYAVLALAGLLTRPQRDYLEVVCTVAVACEASTELPFQAVSTVDELQQRLAEAHASGRWAMLEFHAEWCATCLELEHTTLADDKVRSALSQFALLQVDVTQDNDHTRALLRRFEIIGPPAILFFAPDQQERQSFRVVGYVDSGKFLGILQQLG